jgi:predicted SAM-dependent methyltransferase
MQMYSTLKTRLPGSVKTALKRVTRGAISSEAVHRAAHGLWDEIKIAQMSWAAQKSFQALEGQRNLKVHLGCGGDIRLGWVNIDLALVPPPGFDREAHPDTPLISYDLRQGLPLEAESCAMIYSSHFFEHMEYQHGLRLMQECYRVLRPGGVFRACMPNYRACFTAYLQGDRDFFSLIDYSLVDPEKRLLADYMNYSMYQHGEHVCFYDEERFQFILSRMGFRSVTPTTFHPELDIGAELRKKYSFYIEAVK